MLKRGFSATSEDTVMGKRMGACAACVRSTPWMAYLSSALFAVGLALWIAGAVKIQDYTYQVATAIGMARSVTDGLKAALISIILAVGVTGTVVCVLVLMLALFGTGLRTALVSKTCLNTTGKGPEPWTFTTFRTLVGLLNFLVWLLLLAVVGVLMAMLVWYGASEVINTAIISGRATAGAFGVRLNQASDTAAAALAYLAPLVRTPTAAAELMGTSATIALPFQPLCPPVCLNLGSFAQMLKSDSCVCGSAKLNTIANAASEGVRVGGVALAGAVTMYVAASWLLMILTSQYVSAKYDREAARVRQLRAERDYENGYLADPADCVPATASYVEKYYSDVHGQRDVALPMGQLVAPNGVTPLDLHNHKSASHGV